MNSAEKKKIFNRLLFRWHRTHYRDMPWRRTHDPYRILVSEIMLQQTQVDRVRAKYVQFLKDFPSVAALARAPLGDVLRTWSGLGYNRRARYLHECAKQISAEHQGKIPDDLHELKKLPGIGLSTAGALLVFAFNRDEPMIDTNIRRLLARTFFKKNIPNDDELYVFARSLIPLGKGRAWNYAMLDLGATLCTACNHKSDCPLIKLHGKVGDFQYKKPQKKFAGSQRFYRGKILRFLVEHGTATNGGLSQYLGRTKKEVGDLIKGLGREKLVAFQGNKIILPRR
ncbi:MAG: hypothetical protein A2942_03600 [Candidatus Lloydbacteria bacterium RIFCSPLOWO2_01_FULL_50_20]|uniref:Adenine DNA glycosylase n=1 Tax=Candidatus Lloydbacteria bacterium RIFCSPLOWO2_01_FULL_50_20 TaxID=1798665 RepID=A0A1G2DHY9_9BACT|nr:MAG: hypothetical protein A3C13_02790 [Candidatus Lloydbacteria bacterium RIFCSPHIGHO2_02_FULL_50_11]OGZ13277.1 MAG: hypothetical protein A2942_03600 [Candidatus Lloydbacteria bacterium RIFCSPLOWO2_01_FULL_50_20]